MNIHKALVEARKIKKAIRRKRWLIKNPPETCIYHAIDNTFRWYKGKDNPNEENGTSFIFSIPDLLAVDWEIAESHYNGSRYDLAEDVKDAEKEEVKN
jgi:hypothetical protein